MKTTSVSALLGCLLAYLPDAAYADGIAGWPLLHWGMSRLQVEQTYPNFESYKKIGLTDHGIDWVVVFGLETHLVGGCKFSMSLDFLENQLVSLRLEAIYKKGGFEAGACERVKVILSEKYGRPRTDQPLPTMAPWLKWTAGETEVSYQKADLTESSAITVFYMDERRFMQLIKTPAKDRL